VTSENVIESGILFFVPELESLVGPWRTRYDPSASQGFGAHVTLLVPFKPARSVTPDVVEDLRSFFAEQRLPPLEFGGICAFPNAVYLVPEPEDAVRELIKALTQRYPDAAPYGGKIPLEQLVPHVTVAYSEEPETLVTISEDFCRASAARLPIRADIRQALLIVQDDDQKPRDRAVLPFHV